MQESRLNNHKNGHWNKKFKNLGEWFNQLYSFVKTCDSCTPEMALEPSCSNSGESPETVDVTKTGANSDSEEINIIDKNSISKDGDTVKCIA